MSTFKHPLTALALITMAVVFILAPLRSLHASDLLGVMKDEILDTIDLDQPVHFTTLQASDVVMAAGTYRVTAADQDRIRLISVKVNAPLEIAALNSSHQEDISEPIALYVRDDEKFPHVILLLPGGRTLEAVGSYDIARSRGLEGLRLTLVQIQMALSKKRKKLKDTH